MTFDSYMIEEQIRINLCLFKPNTNFLNIIEKSIEAEKLLSKLLMCCFQRMYSNGIQTFRLISCSITQHQLRTFTTISEYVIWSQSFKILSNFTISDVLKTVLILIITCSINYLSDILLWPRGSVVDKALRYQSDGPGIDSRWCHWIFQGHSPSDRNMTLGLIQPLVKMSTRNISRG